MENGELNERWWHFAGLSLRKKRLVVFGALVAGLLLITAINTYANMNTQKLVSQDLVRQQELSDMTAAINNSLLEAQNETFELYGAWSLHGFERAVDLSGFDYARDAYIIPIQEQLNEIRNNIDAMKQIKAEAETQVRLDQILANVNAYESTLLQMSDEMERLGFRKSGEIGTLYSLRAELDDLFESVESTALEAGLLRIVQHEQDFFQRSSLPAIRLARESISKLKEQVGDLDDTVLAPAKKDVLYATLERYYTHFLAAANLHQQLQNTRPALVNLSDLTSDLVASLFEEQQLALTHSLEQLQRQQSDTLNTTIGLTVLALLVGPIVVYLMTQQTISSIEGLGKTSVRLAKGDLTARALVHGRDEIGQTASAINMMADRLQQLLADLEQRVAERTRELETTAADLAQRSAELEKANQRQTEINRQLQQTVRESQHRATLLQASAEVSRAVARIRDLDQLLPQITQLISHHFGFYHIGVFLLDQAGRYAIFQAANSEGGRRMLARQHRLAVGSEGIVGYVTHTGQPRIALDVGADAVFFNNPDLPSTRSEMALPLRVGDEVIGALDVQSTHEAAFSQQDVTALEAMADQITIAIDNAHLLQQSRTAQQEAEEAYRRYLRQEWNSYLGRPKRKAYRPPMASGTASD